MIDHHLSIPFRALDHQYSFENGNQKSGEVEGHNKIIHGDNLGTLKSLLPAYEGKINCVYVDPPYNTGHEHWVYNDNVNGPEFKKWLGQVVGKESEDLNRHDKWLCMMYPRLVLIHKLLADDGVVFISIDDNEQAHLKLLLDDIFGSKNFIANVIWQHSIQAKNDSKTISLQHNYILIYKKNNFRIGKLKRTAAHNISYSNPDNDVNGPWRTGDVRSPNLRPNLKYQLTTPSGKIIEPPEKGWRWNPQTLLEKIKTGEVTFNKDETKITRKIYLKNQGGRVIESIWFAQDVGTTREANQMLKKIFNTTIPFNTPKPVTLIERIIQISCTKNAIILDPFAGSGTTAHAVLNLNKQDGGNRSFILIEMENYAENITALRAKRVISGYRNKPATGGSFNYYKLGAQLGNMNAAVNKLAG